MDETWLSRDLPVLRAIVKLDEDEDRPSGPFVTIEDLVRETGRPVSDVRKAVRALSREDPSFATFEPLPAMDGPTDWWITDTTGHARRTVGRWPAPMTSEQQAAALVAALHQAEETAPDEASKSTLRKIREGLTSLPAQVAGAVGTAAALKLTGLS